MDLTVVVCTRNRQESLSRTLATVARQECELEWEVLVVDNGSTDGTAACVTAAAADFPAPLRLVREDQQGLSRARNRGLEESRGESVLFIDDDVDCLPGWLASHGRALADTTLAGTGGRIEPSFPDREESWVTRLMETELGGPTSRYDLGEQARDITRSDRVPPPCGANMAVRRSLARELGGFRTDLGWGRNMIPGEESELFFRILERGEHVQYLPDAAVLHRIAPARLTADYYRKWYRGHGRATVLTRPPGGPIERGVWIARELRKLVVSAFRLVARSLAADRQRYGEAMRKCSKAQGRLLQLLGH